MPSNGSKIRRKARFLPHWHDVRVQGIAIGEWCRPFKKEEGRVLCSDCNTFINYGSIGIRALTDHAKSKRHAENRASAHREALKQKALENCDKKATKLVSKQPTLDKCSVDLMPLKIEIASQKCVQSPEKQGQAFKVANLSYGLQKRFVSVFMCFFCCEEFESRENLKQHQADCDMKPPELQAITPPGRADPPSQSAGPASPQLPPVLSHIPPLTPVKQVQRSSYTRPCKSNFVEAIGLIPKKKAAQVCSQRRNTECESIDLDDDVPLSPTPRTPKLLISHLSRENSTGDSSSSPSSFKRRMSLFSHHVDKSINEDEDKGGSVQKDDEESGGKGQKITITKSLYNLNLTSPLGQFVIKHIKGDPNLHILGDVESHCLTSTPKKKLDAVRLRERHSHYPITFRGYSTKAHIHHYKFNKSQKRDFLKRVETGLDRRSRRLLRSMKKCCVRMRYITNADLKQWIPSENHLTVGLQPLSAAEIAYWTSPKPTTTDPPAVFPNGLTFSSPNVKHVLGLRTRPEVPASLSSYPVLSLGSFVSEETLAEVVQHRRTVYKSLLSDSASSGGSSDTENSPPSPSLSLLRQMLSSGAHSRPGKDRTSTSTYGLLSPLATPPEHSRPPTCHGCISSKSELTSFSNNVCTNDCKFPELMNRLKCSVVSDPLSVCVEKTPAHSVNIQQMASSGQMIKATLLSPLSQALSSIHVKDEGGRSKESIPGLTGSPSSPVQLGSKRTLRSSTPDSPSNKIAKLDPIVKPRTYSAEKTNSALRQTQRVTRESSKKISEEKCSVPTKDKLEYNAKVAHGLKSAELPHQNTVDTRSGKRFSFGPIDREHSKLKESHVHCNGSKESDSVVHVKLTSSKSFPSSLQSCAVLRSLSEDRSRSHQRKPAMSADTNRASRSNSLTSQSRPVRISRRLMDSPLNVRRYNSLSEHPTLRRKLYLRRSMSVSKQAEERKSLLTSFLA